MTPAAVTLPLRLGRVDAPGGRHRHLATGSHDALMITVDSNTWADFFNRVQSPHGVRLDHVLLEEEDLGFNPIIITEALQVFRTDTGFKRAQGVLVSLPVIHPNVDGHVRAVRLFRSLRRKGVTVRGAVGCVIAHTCLDIEAELLSPNADFEQIARHAPLRLWRP
jgi:predicted nucleic acid-binding protein